jgi:hypothetical protein
MPIRDSIASCAGTLSPTSALIFFFAALSTVAVISILYLDGYFTRSAAPTKPERYRPHRPGSRHNCKNAAWRNPYPSNPE